MPFILSFAHMGRESIKEVGGKGANLGEMVKAGLPVPPGFVVTTEAYMKFLKSNEIDSDIAEEIAKINADDIDSLNKGAEKIRKLILGSRIPDVLEREIKEAYVQLSLGKEMKGLSGPALDLVKAGRNNAIVAVRSSATSEDLADASFAGQLESILSVQGYQKLFDAIRQCWASLFTPRVIFYRKTKGFTEFPSMGVIVQRMVQSEKAGVMFTANPMNNDVSQMVVESAWGYGESIVSGLVTPDEYVLSKPSGEVISKRIGKKKWLRRMDPISGSVIKEDVEQSKVDAEVLTSLELRKLWELGRRVEEYYGGKPQDIEWCIERNRAFLVQTRAITTLGARTIKHGGGAEGHVLLAGLGASPGKVSGRVRLAPDAETVKSMEHGEILVTTMTTPSMVPLMRKAAAIVTDEGGSTCHAAIISRELGVPCIVGTGNATKILRQGQDIVVDAAEGKVYEAANAPDGTAPISQSQAQEAAAGLAVFSELPVPSSDVMASSERPESHQEARSEPSEKDGLTATSIKANIAFPEAAARAAPRADGVGLLRAEHMLASSGRHPAHLARTDPEELVRIVEEGIGAIAKAFHPKPVWYRTLDARTDEFRDMEGGAEEPHETNPMLGWHGIRRSLDDPCVFRCELQAIRNLRQKGLDNVCIMLPFIISVEELRKAKSMIDFPAKVGIMVETPAAVTEIESFCREGIAFASIGSNDLTQLMLGVDRNNARLAGLYSEFHPAVLSAIRSVISSCRKHNVEISLCGESGSNPRMAELLVEAGIDSISVEADAIDSIRQVAARAERKILLRRLRE
jgi:pyruvate,water dikinase